MAVAATGGDPDAGKVKICSGHTRPICHINYSPVADGTFWFVTSCHDSKPMLRNGESGDWVGTFEGHKGAVYASAFNSDATKLVTGSGDYSAIIWDAVKGTNLHAWNHPHYIKAVDWMDNRIVTGCYDSNVRVFDAEKYDAAPTIIKAHETPIVKAAYFVKDTKNLVTCSEGTIKHWDLRSDKCTKTTEVNKLKVLEYCHDKYLVAAHEKNISFIDPITLDVVHTVVTSDDVECASLSPCGRYIAAGSKIKAKELTWEGTELESHRGHHGPIFHIRWATDGATFASGSEDGMVRIWPANDVIRRLQDN